MMVLEKFNSKNLMIFAFQKYKSKSSGWCKLAPIFCDKFQHNHALHWLQLSQYLPILQRKSSTSLAFGNEFLCLFVCFKNANWFKVFVSVSRSVCLCLCLYLQDILFLQWWPTSDNKPRLLWDQGVGGSERWGRHLCHQDQDHRCHGDNNHQLHHESWSP